jgi:hypothetical protein
MAHSLNPESTSGAAHAGKTVASTMPIVPFVPRLNSASDAWSQARTHHYLQLWRLAA